MQEKCRNTSNRASGELGQLEAIFRNIKCPVKGFLTEVQPSEWEYIYARLRGKQWRDLVVADIDAQGGIIEGIQCLRPNVFVYFLPGLMKLILNDKAARYCIIYGILSRFTGPEDQGAASARDKQAALELLSSKQRHFVAGFLADNVKHEPTLCRTIVDSAILSLEHGHVKTYRQADLLKEVAAYK